MNYSNFLPQAIWISLIIFSLLYKLSMHGKPETPGKHNFFILFISQLIGFVLLYWGHFFDPLIQQLSK